MHYASPKHERLFLNVIRGRGYPSSTLAALFLLTSHRKLWKKWQRAVSGQGIDWAADRNIDPGWNGGALQDAALSIANHNTRQQVPLWKLADSVEYPREQLRLVITALVIAREDRDVITEFITSKKGTKPTC
jgi:hypothetical protein